MSTTIGAPAVVADRLRRVFGDFIAVDEGQIETLKQSLSGAQREPLPKMAPAVKKPLNAAPAGKPLPGKAPPRKLPPQ